MSSERPDRPFRLGFIGLGIMGVPMARRLAERGWQVTAWNLEPERFELVRSAGIQWAESPAAVRAAADIVMICVLGDEAVESVCFGTDGLAASTGAEIVVDFSTTGIDTTQSVASRLAVEWLDCPISGGPQAAEEGALTLMAGGGAELFARLRPLLEELGGNVTLMGGLGAGQTTKIINQAIVGVNYVLMGEVLAMVRAAGIDGTKLAQCLRGGAADSAILQRIFPQILAYDFDPPRGRAKQLNKDLQAVAAFNAASGLELPVQEAAIGQYERYVAAGNGEADSASVARLYGEDEGR
jgi:3-hydroxyisobutyrate dehydrogenase